MFRLAIAFFMLTLAVTSALAQATPSPSPTPEVADPCADSKTQLRRLQNQLKDWPALGRYREANTRVPPPQKDETRVVFIGDSITDSWDDPKFGGFFPGKPYINRGISGQTTPQMLIRFRAEVIALKPKVVVILAGTNDIAGNTGPTTLEAIEDNFMSMAELARASGIRVVLASVTPINDYGKRNGSPLVRSQQRPPDQIKALNQWLQKYSTDNRFTYLDYYSAMVDDQGFLKAELSEDGLHPNQKGYEIMSPLAERAIDAALKRKQ